MNEEELLQQAIKLIRNGDKAAGQKLLIQILRSNPKNEDAWLWLSACLDELPKRKECLQRVLTLNPDNQKARKALAHLNNLNSSKSNVQKQPRPKTISSISARPWYRTSLVYILTFVFLTPIWALLVLTDPQQKSGVKILAGIVAIIYLRVCAIIVFPSSNNSISQESAKQNVEIEFFNCNMTPGSMYEGNFHGRVSNTGEKSLRFVELRGIIKNNSGQVVATNTGFVDSDLLMPGAISDFSFFVDYSGRWDDKECFLSVESAMYAE